MASQGPTFAISTADLTLDDEGRVHIQNPELAESVVAAMASSPNASARATTNNCHGGNCAKGCGKSVER
ncbi:MULTISPECIES: hypothetical protein [unclassified Streptomyces]|uniref:hypothetical protein n=1 Tax=Streptomycetaceae TaxID=2062 RepID=UPI002E75C778|nr:MULTISPECIES: hypothetical protein [unclassified Streptomyces]MED7954928.1 hypothetical protein [Streptomyces sp. BE303]MEE1827936.1 hypothetical protein [Streptomyces sp. BE20]